ncbi:hypothetical protein HFO98_04390 [Rhizobium leguminosarum]|uniref:hypothetical protein n=1 Tax=Rhizobium leguminosarum TaxID=384 RepID=UPI001C93F087|nr:hypothetical protein [Rhizobium leguminosarum]MBY5336461.1 hypothetical protein [Rhizobium leguminosarum]MBY5407723.1 hypothetical protein [Rhizobium leguminosarum]
MADKKFASFSKALVSGEGAVDDRLFKARSPLGNQSRVISPSFNLEITHGCGAETHYRRRIVFSGANRIRRASNGQRRQIMFEAGILRL